MSQKKFWVHTQQAHKNSIFSIFSVFQCNKLPMYWVKTLIYINIENMNVYKVNNIKVDSLKNTKIQKKISKKIFFR